MSIEVNDENFIELIRQRNEDALEWIVDKYAPYVKTIVNKVLYNFNDIELVNECINDVFLSVWDNIFCFKGDTKNFQNWIFSISRFKAIDKYRKYIKKNVELKEEIEIEQKCTLEDEIIVSENKKEVLEILDALNEIDKKIFIMKYLMDFTSEEIGEKLDLTKASVENRIYRCKKKLRKSPIGKEAWVI